MTLSLKIGMLICCSDYALYAMNPAITQDTPLVSCTLKEIVPDQKIYQRLNEKLAILSNDIESSHSDLEEAFNALYVEAESLLDESLKENAYEKSTFFFDFIERLEQRKTQKHSDFLVAYERCAHDFHTICSNYSNKKFLEDEEIFKKLSTLNTTLLTFYEKTKTEAPLYRPLFFFLQEKVSVFIKKQTENFSEPFLLDYDTGFFLINPATIDMEDVD